MDRTIDYWADEIVKNLWLGGYNAGEDLVALTNSGITHILVVGTELQVSHPQRFTYLHIKAKDEEDFNISDYFQTCASFIYKALQSGGKILIHCYEGKSRSASIVIAYLMICKRITFIKSIQYVRSKRKATNPNVGFIKQLEMLDSYLQNKRYQ